MEFGTNTAVLKTITVVFKTNRVVVETNTVVFGIKGLYIYYVTRRRGGVLLSKYDC